MIREPSAFFNDDLEVRATTLIRRAAAAGLTFATAESCTGGLVAGLLTEIAGSSAVVDRGFVTYSNEAKQQMLGVPEALLKTYGAVSEEVARAMANGARKYSAAHISVAITGVAGPGGGTEAKPVGLVHFACAAGSGVKAVEKRFGDIGRAGVRRAAVSYALELLEEAVAQNAP